MLDAGTSCVLQVTQRYVTDSPANVYVANRVGVNRYNFLLESLTDLNEGLKARGSRLLVVRGQPQEVLPKLFKVSK